MNLADFCKAVASHPGRGVRVELASRALAPHFHVTEVGHVTKDFVDCGGVRRTETRCTLQTLVAGDTEHRLDTTKLAKILAFVDRLDLPSDAVVEVEHQERSVSTDAVKSVGLDGEMLVIRLEPKQTACLAEDACGLPGGGLPQLTTITGGCDSPGCC